MIKLSVSLIVLYCLIHRLQAVEPRIYRTSFAFAKKDREIRGSYILEDTFFHLLCRNENEGNCSVTRITKVFDKEQSESKTCQISLRRQFNTENLQMEALNNDRLLFIGPEYNLVDMRYCSHTRASITDRKEERQEFFKELVQSLAEFWDNNYTLRYRNEECRGTCNAWIGGYHEILEKFNDQAGKMKLKQPFDSINVTKEVRGVELFLFKDNKEIKHLKTYPELSDVTILSSAYNYVTVLVHPSDFTKQEAIIAQFDMFGGLTVEMYINLWSKQITGFHNLPNGGFSLITADDDVIGGDIVKNIDINGREINRFGLNRLSLCRSYDNDCSELYVNKNGEYCLSSIDYKESKEAGAVYEATAKCVTDENL